MLKALIFDMDGLLIDSEHVYHKAWIESGMKNGVYFDESELRNWAGQGIVESQRRLTNILKDVNLVEQIKNDREKYIIKQLKSNNINLKPYAMEVLQAANSLGIKCGIASSSNKIRGQMFIDYFSLENLISFSTFGDEVIYTKPSPDIYIESLKKAKVSVQEAIALEDSITGAKSATNAGLSLFFIPDQSMNLNFSLNEKEELNILQEGTSLKIVLDYLKNSTYLY